MLTDQEIEGIFGFHPAPGNTGVMWDLQHKITGRASTLSGASDGLNGIRADTWIGQGADSFEGTIGNLRRDVATAAGVHTDVANALYGYVSEHEQAKTQAQSLAQQALAAHQTHQAALNQVSQHSTARANEDDAAKTDREQSLHDAQRQADTAQGDFDGIMRKARALKEHMESAASKAAQAINAAAERAPYEKPGFWQQAWDDVKGAAGDVWHVVSSPEFLHDLSTVLSIVSAVCAFIPGLQWVAIVAAVAAVGFGMLGDLAAGKSINWGEVGLGLALAVVPGGKFGKALEETSSLARFAKEGEEAYALDEAGQLGAQAREARNAAGEAEGRAHATYGGGYDPETGQVYVGRSQGGLCAENDIEAQMGKGNDAPHFEKAFGWRRDFETGELVWEEIPVCINCQGRYDISQFPSDVTFDLGGRWSQ